MNAALDQQAADWVIRLNEGNLSEREQQQFERWKAADPSHAAAVERIQGFVGRLQSLRPQHAPVQAALEAARVRRRNPAGRVLLGLLVAVPVAMALRVYPPSYLLADQRTAPAEWRQVSLQDGSQLTLSGNSAVDLAFNGQQRQVRLVRGEILVQVAHDAARPFTVVTDDGQIRALGTRFTVKLESAGTLLSMLESTVAATDASGHDDVHVSAGEQARITPDAVNQLGKIDPHATDDAWQHHQWVIQDRPLPEVLDQLARQYGGHVQFDRQQLADLRVSAVLPLDNPRRALQLIADGLPVRIRSFSPLWLRIERHEK